MTRHFWDIKGPWRSSHDVRRCCKCGLRAHKVGQRIGWMTSRDARNSEGDDRWSYSDRLPPCPGYVTDPVVRAAIEGAS